MKERNKFSVLGLSAVILLSAQFAYALEEPEFLNDEGLIYFEHAESAARQAQRATGESYRGKKEEEREGRRESKENESEDSKDKKEDKKESKDMS